MIFNYRINGLPLQTGDIICTTNGAEEILPGEFWRLLGRLLPGAVDHIVIYVGPEGRCVEGGAKGVINFEVKEGVWATEKMVYQRGPFFDTFYGVAYPLQGRGFSEKEEMQILKTIHNNDTPLIRFWRWPDGCQSALSVTGDIDAITVVDFFNRSKKVSEKSKKNNGF